MFHGQARLVRLLVVLLPRRPLSCCRLSAPMSLFCLSSYLAELCLLCASFSCSGKDDDTRRLPLIVCRRRRRQLGSQQSAKAPATSSCLVFSPPSRRLAAAAAAAAAARSLSIWPGSPVAPPMHTPRRGCRTQRATLYLCLPTGDEHKCRGEPPVHSPLLPAPPSHLSIVSMPRMLFTPDCDSGGGPVFFTELGASFGQPRRAAAVGPAPDAVLRRVLCPSERRTWPVRARQPERATECGGSSLVGPGHGRQVRSVDATLMFAGNRTNCYPAAWGGRGSGERGEPPWPGRERVRAATPRALSARRLAERLEQANK